MEERKNIKLRMTNIKSIRLQEQLKTAYTAKAKEVKRSAKRDRRIFVDNLVHEAEQAACHSEMSTVNKITKQLCGKTTPQPARITHKTGKPLSTEHEQAKRWVQYFQDVLNCPEADEPSSPDPAEEDLDSNIE